MAKISTLAQATPQTTADSTAVSSRIGPRTPTFPPSWMRSPKPSDQPSWTTCRPWPRWARRSAPRSWRWPAPDCHTMRRGSRTHRRCSIPCGRCGRPQTPTRQPVHPRAQPRRSDRQEPGLRRLRPVPHGGANPLPDPRVRPDRSDPARFVCPQSRSRIRLL